MMLPAMSSQFLKGAAGRRLPGTKPADESSARAGRFEHGIAPEVCGPTAASRPEEWCTAYDAELIAEST